MRELAKKLLQVEIEKNNFKISLDEALHMIDMDLEYQFEIYSNELTVENVEILLVCIKEWSKNTSELV